MNKKTKTIIPVIFLGLIIISSTLFGIFGTKKSRNYTDEYEITKNAYNIAHIEIYNRVDNLDINFKFLPENSSNILEAQLDCVYFDSFRVVPFDFSISHELSGENLNITVSSSEREEDLFFHSVTWDYTIWISSDYESYVFDSETLDGDIFIEAKGDFDFERFDVSIRDGNFVGYLNQTSIKSNLNMLSQGGHMSIDIDKLSIHGNILCNSDSGNIDFNLWDVRFPSPSFINLSSDSGAVALFWAQHVKYNNSVEVSVESNLTTKIQFWCRNEFVRQDVQLSGEGSVLFKSGNIGTFNKIAENIYQNTNYADESADYFKFTLYGKLKTEIYVVDCFKPARYHLQTGGWWGSLTQSKTISGSFAMNLSEFAVDEIRFYHNAKVHFDIPSNLNITKGILSESSNSLFEINWNLTHNYAGNHGFGSLTPTFQYNITDSIMNLVLILDFDETLIFPAFTSGGLTIDVHPDVTFSELN